MNFRRPKLLTRDETRRRCALAVARDRARRRMEGRCQRCGCDSPPEPGRNYCRPCQDDANERKRVLRSIRKAEVRHA